MCAKGSSRRPRPAGNHLTCFLSFFLVLFGIADGVLDVRAYAQSSPSERTWHIESIAGTGTAGHEGNEGLATKAQLNNPFGIVRGPDGAVWFCEYGSHRIRRIDSHGVVTTISGQGIPGNSPDGTATKDCSFNLPHEIRWDQDGRLLVVDMANHSIRRFDSSLQRIETVAGTGVKGYSGDEGPAIEAQLNQPHSVQLDTQGNIFICDIGNHLLRRVDGKTGIITTIAGTGKPGPTRDGDSLFDNPLNGPRSLDFDSQGHLWLGTREGNQLFEIDLDRARIHLRAGSGKKGLPPKVTAANEVTLNGPKGVAIDAEGNVWLADTESHCILRFNPKTSTVQRIAGTGAKGDGPDGPADQCALARPHGVFADTDGSILVGDSEAHRIRRIYLR
jgi:streptogramin lyase